MCMRHSAVSAERLYSVTHSSRYQSGRGHTQSGRAVVAGVAGSVAGGVRQPRTRTAASCIANECMHAYRSSEQRGCMRRPTRLSSARDVYYLMILGCEHIYVLGHAIWHRIPAREERACNVCG